VPTHHTFPNRTTWVFLSVSSPGEDLPSADSMTENKRKDRKGRKKGGGKKGQKEKEDSTTGKIK